MPPPPDFWATIKPTAPSALGPGGPGGYQPPTPSGSPPSAVAAFFGCTKKPGSPPSSHPVLSSLAAVAAAPQYGNEGAHRQSPSRSATNGWERPSCGNPSGASRPATSCGVWGGGGGLSPRGAEEWIGRDAARPATSCGGHGGAAGALPKAAEEWGCRGDQNPGMQFGRSPLAQDKIDFEVSVAAECEYDDEAALQRDFLRAAAQLSQEELREFVEDHVAGELASIRSMPSEHRAQAFRSLCAEWHPDKCPAIAGLATEIFQRLQSQKSAVLHTP